jgi:hypothetical protein
MVKKIIFTGVTLFLLLAYAYAQQTPNGVELSKFIPTSPEAASLGKYGDIGVSYYTGSPSIGIPLYDIKARDITVPISLSYNATGIKVEEVGSRVGMGWSLNAGGVITRNVRGRPDDLYRGYIDGTNATDRLLAADVTNVPGYMTAIEASKSIIDAEPDLFYINAGGVNAKFFFDQTGGIHILPDQKLKITYTLTNNEKGITSFSVLTNEGFTYTFGGLTNDGRKIYEDQNMPEFSGGTVGSNTEAWVITAWYLSSIKSPLGEKVDFDYYSRHYEFEIITTVNKYHFLDMEMEAIPGGDFTYGNNDCPIDFLFPCALNYESMYSEVCPTEKVPKDNVLRKTSKYDVLNLKSISFYNGRVEFHEFEQRQDQPGLYSLAAINVFNSNNYPIKNFKFSYDYSSRRLMLKKVEEGQAGIQEDGTPIIPKEYILDYYTGELPADRNSYSRDHWGYFNGEGNTTLVPEMTYKFPKNHPDNGTYDEVYLPGAKRGPNFTYGKIANLQKITYPTGGSSTFEYEPNTQSNKKHEYSVLKAMKSYNTNISNEANELDANGNPLFIFQQHFSVYNALLKSTKIDVVANGLSNGTAGLNRRGIVERKDAQGNYTIVVAYITQATPHIILTNGDYRLRIDEGGINNNPPLFLCRLQWSNDTEEFYAGGLRIKRIINEDPFSPTKKIVKRYEYKLDNSTLSSGFTQDIFNYSYEMKDRYKYGCVSGGPGDGSYLIKYLIRTSTSNYPMFQTEGSSIGYAKVTEYNGENGEAGKNDFYFTSQERFQDVQHLDLPFAPADNQDFLRGKLHKSQVYRKEASGFSLLSESLSTQAMDNSYSGKAAKVGFNPRVIQRPNPDFKPLGDGVNVQEYKVNTAHVYNQSNKTIEYDPSNPGLSMTNESEVLATSPINYLPTHTLAKVNNGQEVYQYITYVKDLITQEDVTFTAAGDLETAGLLRLRLNDNTIAPVEIIMVKKLDDGLLYVMDATLNIYNPFVNELEAVYKIEAKIPIPFDQFKRCYMQSPGRDMPLEFRYDSRYVKKIAMNVYDAKGNVLEQRKENDLTQLYVWDYQQTLPTAMVVFPRVKLPNPIPYNGRAIEYPAYKPWVAYTSFETAEGGNWEGINEAEINITNAASAVTGKGTYFISNPLVFNNLLDNEVYYVTVWVKDDGNASNISVNEASGELLAKRNGWNLMRFEIKSATSASVMGKCEIDELRLYPKEGRISTYTYEPLLGVTSTCDENNNVTYYEYDINGRLRLLRDKDRNIIKMLDYQLKK